MDRLPFILLIFCALFCAQPSFADSLFSLSFRDNGVSVEKRVLDTYQAALNSKTDNAVKTEINKLGIYLEGFGKVRAPTKADLLLLTSGHNAPSEHNSSLTTKSGKFLLAIPARFQGLSSSDDHVAFITAHYLVQPGKRVDVILEHFSEINGKFNEAEAVAPANTSSDVEATAEAGLAAE